MSEEQKIDLDELDWKFVRLQRGAEALERGLWSLDDSSFREFLSSREKGSDYCSRLYHRLKAIHMDYWKFRLALLWDLFPGRRAAALGYCQRKFEEATKAIEKLQRERPRDIGPSASESLVGARVLLSPAKNVSTQEFAEGMAVLAEQAAFYCSWVNGLDEQGTLTAFYQDLDEIMVPEQVERTTPPRAPRRR